MKSRLIKISLISLLITLVPASMSAAEVLSPLKDKRRLMRTFFFPGVVDGARVRELADKGVRLTEREAEESLLFSLWVRSGSNLGALRNSWQMRGRTLFTHSLQKGSVMADEGYQLLFENHQDMLKDRASKSALLKSVLVESGPVASRAAASGISDDRALTHYDSPSVAAEQLSHDQKKLMTLFFSNCSEMDKKRVRALMVDKGVRLTDQQFEAALLYDFCIRKHLEKMPFFKFTTGGTEWLVELPEKIGAVEDLYPWLHKNGDEMQQERAAKSALRNTLVAERAAAVKCAEAEALKDFEAVGIVYHG